MAPVASVPPGAEPPGLGALDIRSAYNLPPHAGKGQTVAIVVAHDYPTAEHDMAVYRRQFNLPPCTSASGCFRKINQRGGSLPPPSVDPGWAAEAAIDTQMVTAACPACNILLVEADDNSNLLAAVDQARTKGAKFISMSWGRDEDPSQRPLDRIHFDHPGIAFVAASGDAGFPNLIWPAASPFTTAAGGTQLEHTGAAEPYGGHEPDRDGWQETAWPDAGSGCSRTQPKPPFQHDPDCPNRTVADVSAVAENVAIYTTTPNPAGETGWLRAFGTSVATPIIASAYAMAGDPRPHDRPNSYPYRHRKALHDIIQGSTGSCTGSYLCTAVPGYDGPTGNGTPNGVRAFRP
ncbi:S8 family serine peptidase [Streptomyces sp. NPDC101151]|uniref:S53 family peptidase n=1 Tax=Streptomyces sp. NPDC101151 TaxID=3366115 RepID=UPI003816BC51